MLEQIFSGSLLDFFVSIVEILFSIYGSLAKLLATVYKLVVTFISYIYYFNPVIAVCLIAAIAFGLVYGLLKFINQLPFI